MLQVVNADDQPVPARLTLDGFKPARPIATVEELAGPLDARNTARNPNRLVPASKTWTHGLASGAARHEFAARSFTVIRFE